MDDALKHDLAAVAGNGVELAPRPQSQVVISAIEAGPASAPAVAPRKAAPKAPSRSARARGERTGATTISLGRT